MRNRFPRAGWHNVARRPLFWSDNVDYFQDLAERVERQERAIAALMDRVDALVNIVELLLLEVDPNVCGGPLSDLTRWRREARRGK